MLEFNGWLPLNFSLQGGYALEVWMDAADFSSMLARYSQN
jgi:hypothetical protein